MGRAVVPRHPLRFPGPDPRRLQGGGLYRPAQPPPPHGERRGATRPSLPRAPSGLFGSPGRRARYGWQPVGESGGGGGVPAPRPELGRGGPGAGGGGSLCLGPFLCLPQAGIQAARYSVALSLEGVAPILHQLASACSRPDAVRGVPLRTGAGLLACRGYCGSWLAADLGRADYGPSGAPPRLRRPARGGGSPLARRGGCGPPSPWLASGRPWAQGGRGRRGREGCAPLSTSSPPVLPSGGCGGAA